MLMMDKSKKKQKRSYILLLCLLGSALIACTTGSTFRSSTSSFEQARQSALDGLHKGAKLGKDYILRAVPALATGKTYELGSIFVADNYPLRHSNKCLFKQSNPPETIPRSLSLTNGRDFDISFQFPEKLIKSIPKVNALGSALKGKQKALFSYEIEKAVTVDIQNAMDQLATKECWADIANRDVWVLVGIFSAKEKYSSTSSLNSSAKIQVLNDDSLKVSVDSNGNFVVEDFEFSPRIWVFLPYRVDIPNFNPKAPKRARVAMAEDHIGDFEGPVAGVKVTTKGIDSRLLTTNLSQLN